MSRVPIVVALVVLLAGVAVGGPVILDPGSGGVVLEDGREERAITSAVARSIMDQLRGTHGLPAEIIPGAADPDDRAAAANQRQGSHYVGLEMGRGATLGVRLYVALPRGDEVPPRPSWSETHEAHLPASRRWAALLAAALEEQGVPVRQQEAPLAVLEGLNLPGVVLEVVLPDENATTAGIEAAIVAAAVKVLATGDGSP